MTYAPEVRHDPDEADESLDNFGLLAGPSAAAAVFETTSSKTMTVSAAEGSQTCADMARPNSACPRYHAFAAATGAVASSSDMLALPAASPREGGQDGAARMAGSAGSKGWQPTPSTARAVSSALLGGLRYAERESDGGKGGTERE